MHCYIHIWRMDDYVITPVCATAAIVLPAVGRCLPMTRSHATHSPLNHTLSRSCLLCHVSGVRLLSIYVACSILTHSSLYSCEFADSCIHCDPEKTPKCFLIYSLQKLTDCDNVYQILSESTGWFNGRYDKNILVCFFSGSQSISSGSGHGSVKCLTFSYLHLYFGTGIVGICTNVLRMQHQPEACASDLGDGQSRSS